MRSCNLSSLGVYMQPLEPRRLMAFTAIGAETTVAGSGGSRNFDLAVAGDGSYLIAMVVGEQDATISAVRYSASGVQIGSALTIDSVSGSFTPTVSASIDADGDAVVVYEKPGDEIFFARISKAGVVSPPVKVASAPPGDNQLASPSISMNSGGGFFVGWVLEVEVGPQFNDAIQIRAYDAAGAPRGAAFTAATAASYPSFSRLSALDIAAKPDGSSAVFVYGVSSEVGSDVSVGRVNTSARMGDIASVSGFERNLPDAAVRADGSFVIGYQNFPPLGAAPGTEARAVQFDASGQALERQILLFPANTGDSITDDSHSISVDVLPDVGFAAAFVHTTYEGADSTSIVYARRFNAEGVADAAGAIEFDRQKSFRNSEFSIVPSIGADDNGNAVVAYLDTATDTVRFRRSSDDFATLDGSDLYIFGTEGDDAIDVKIEGSNVVVTRGERELTFDAAQVTMLSISGLTGNDSITNNTALPSTISGGEGDDTIIGGSGKDKLRGLAGRDSISGGNGNDTLFGDDGVDSLFGNGGRDRIDGGANADHIRGNAGRDKLFGGGGNDRIYGGASGDWLFGGAHEDQLTGEGGDDRLYAEDGADTLHGNAGNDFFFARDLRIDQLFGGGGRDSATADDDDDELTSIESLL